MVPLHFQPNVLNKKKYINITQLKIAAVISKLGQRGDQRREDADEGRSPDRNRNLSESLSHQSVHPIMSWKDWFKEPQYYQVIGGKMLIRI